MMILYSKHTSNAPSLSSPLRNRRFVQSSPIKLHPNPETLLLPPTTQATPLTVRLGTMRNEEGLTTTGFGAVASLTDRDGGTSCTLRVDGIRVASY